MQDQSTSSAQIPTKPHNTSLEARLTRNALDDYQLKKNRYIKNKRLFDDDKIAVLDRATQNRTSLVASLLGNSREAQSI